MLFAIALTLFLPTLSRANDFLSLFIQQSFVIPQKLQLQRSLGDIDFITLISEMKGINWELNNTGFFLAGSGETRTGAIYNVKEKKVTLNSGRERFEPKRTMSVAALHEALGALGYVDENYDISCLLFLNTLTEIERVKYIPNFSLEISNRRLIDLPRRTADELYAGTSVGGGGDGFVVQMKIDALIMADNICATLNLSCSNIHEKILNTKIEINSSILINSVTDEIKNSEYVVRVPMLVWLNGNLQTNESELSTEQLRILIEIIEKVRKSTI